MTTPNVGVAIMMTMIVLITEKRVNRNDLSDLGITSSII